MGAAWFGQAEVEPGAFAPPADENAGRLGDDNEPPSWDEALHPDHAAENLASAGSGRPAVIAIVENNLPAIEHPEFAFAQANESLVVSGIGIPKWSDSVNATSYRSHFYRINHFTHIEGSRIIGVIPVGPPSNTGDNISLDVGTHGTAVASRAVGTTVGACPSCLLVYVSGETTEALGWIYHQDWIDVVSVSRYNPAGAIGEGAVEAVANLTRTGRPVFVGNGNEPRPPNLDDGLYSSQSIAVGAVYSDGAVAPHFTPGADIMTTGLHVEVAEPSGEIGMSGGTSFASPYLAGAWGAFLTTAWEWKALVRETNADGGVLNRVGEGWTAADSPLLDDAVLDAFEVLAVLAGFTSQPTKFYATEEVPTFGADISYYTGYGNFLEIALPDLRNATRDGLPAAPEMTESHNLNRVARAQSEAAQIAAHNVWCNSDGLLLGMPFCFYHYYLEHNDWYVF